MDEITFQVKGSRDEPYEVVFRHKGNNLSAYCNCPAGKNDMFCKHRLRIFEGSVDGIVSSNLEEVKIVQTWFIGSNVEKAIMELSDAEKDLSEAKKKVLNIKRKLARIVVE